MFGYHDINDSLSFVPYMQVVTAVNIPEITLFLNPLFRLTMTGILELIHLKGYLKYSQFI